MEEKKIKKTIMTCIILVCLFTFLGANITSHAEECKKIKSQDNIINNIDSIITESVEAEFTKAYSNDNKEEEYLNDSIMKYKKVIFLIYQLIKICCRPILIYHNLI